MKALMAFLIMTTAANAADDSLEAAAFMLITKTVCNERIDEAKMHMNFLLGAQERGITVDQAMWFSAGIARGYTNVMRGKNAISSYCGVTP